MESKVKAVNRRLFCSGMPKQLEQEILQVPHPSDIHYPYLRRSANSLAFKIGQRSFALLSGGCSNGGAYRRSCKAFKQKMKNVVSNHTSRG